MEIIDFLNFENIILIFRQQKATFSGILTCNWTVSLKFSLLS